MLENIKLTIIASPVLLTISFIIGYFGLWLVASIAVSFITSRNYLNGLLIVTPVIGIIKASQYRRNNDYIIRKLTYGQRDLAVNFMRCFKENRLPNAKQDYDEYKLYLLQRRRAYRSYSSQGSINKTDRLLGQLP